MAGRFISSAHALPRRVLGDGFRVCLTGFGSCLRLPDPPVSAFKGGLEKCQAVKETFLLYRLDRSGGGEGRVAPRPRLPAATIIFTFPNEKTPLMAALGKGDASLSGSAPSAKARGGVASGLRRGSRCQAWPGSFHQQGLINFSVWLPATFSPLISQTASC